LKILFSAEGLAALSGAAFFFSPGEVFLKKIF